MRSFTFLTLLFSAIPFSLADVEFIKPTQGGSLPAGTIDIAWKDNGNAPSLSDLSTYQIDLLAGGDTDADSVVVSNIVPANTPFTPKHNAQGTVSASTGGDVANAYYLRITSISKEGGQTITFSPRFSITGMTGSFPESIAPTVQKPINNLVGRSAQVAAGGGAVAPAAPPAVAPAAPPAVAPAAPAAPPAASFAVSYGDQTGPTRYAPMMKQPPSSITQKNTSPLFPTSSVSYAKTFLPPAAQLDGAATTLTQSAAAHVSQMENTVSLHSSLFSQVISSCLF